MTWIDLHDEFPTPIPQRKIKPDPIIRNKYDWKIHKILGEAKKVYICPARGNDKLYTQLELYSELMAQNKEITLRKDIENWRPKVYLDTSLINPRDWYNKQLTIMDSVLGSFIVASGGE